MTTARLLAPHLLPLLLAAASQPACRRSDAAAMPAHTAPGSTSTIAPGQSPRASVAPAGAGVTMAGFTVHAGEGVVFRRSDGRWIARASLSVSNEGSTPRGISRAEFVSLDGMVPWAGATTVPEITVAPGASAAGDVAFVGSATPEPPRALHLRVIGAQGEATGAAFVLVPLAPGAPRRPGGAMIDPPAGFFSTLRRASTSAAPAGPELRFDQVVAESFRGENSRWVVRVSMGVGNTTAHPIVLDRALFHARVDGEPLAEIEARALAAHPDDPAGYAADVSAGYAGCRTDVGQTAMPEYVLVPAGDAVTEQITCFEREGSRPRVLKIELTYGLADAPIITDGPVVLQVSPPPAQLPGTINLAPVSTISLE